jgi:hypothetical protein
VFCLGPTRLCEFVCLSFSLPFLEMDGQGARAPHPQPGGARQCFEIPQSGKDETVGYRYCTTAL